MAVLTVSFALLSARIAAETWPSRYNLLVAEVSVDLSAVVEERGA